MLSFTRGQRCADNLQKTDSKYFQKIDNDGERSFNTQKYFDTGTDIISFTNEKDLTIITFLEDHAVAFKSFLKDSDFSIMLRRVFMYCTVVKVTSAASDR